jgi:cytochrome P450
MKLLRKAKDFVRARVAPREHRLLFAFTGGSGAWPGMGRSLYRENGVFREAIDHAGAVVEAVLGWDAAALFRGEDDPPVTLELERRNEVIHLGMLELAQVDLWRDAGVRPGGVLSVSLGEMVAPYAASALTREDCARVLAAVSHAISRTPSDERMFIVKADRETAGRMSRSAPAPLDYLGSMTLSLSVVLSRGRDVETIRAFLGDALVRELETDWNYHTPNLDVDRAWLHEQLRGLKPLPPVCPIYSSAAGGAIRSGAPFDAQFYAWMVSRPFRYADALAAALQDGFDAIVTLGPQPSNNVFIADTARGQGREIVLIDSMRANQEQETWRNATAAVRALRIAAPRPKRADPRTLDLRHADLFPLYEELRRVGPMHYLGRHRQWLLLGYDDVQRALGDAERFSSDVPMLHQTDPVLLGSDPPAHTSVRRIISRHFSAEATARRAEHAERAAERLLRPLAEGRELDVVWDFANPLASAVAADLIGLDDYQALIEPMRAAAGDTRTTYANLQEPIGMLAPHTAIHAELLRDGLDDAAARSLVRLLWIAGTTPKRAVASAVLLLLERDDVRRRVQADPSRLGAFVDEALRLRPPAHFLPRVVTEDVVVSGTKIPAGAIVQLCLAAANRDPGQFDDPLALRLDRASNPHLSFGGGIHRCIGAPLGRAQVLAALRSLFRIAPDFRAVQPLGTVRYAPGAPERQVEQLVIGP